MPQIDGHRYTTPTQQYFLNKTSSIISLKYKLDHITYLHRSLHQLLIILEWNPKSIEEYCTRCHDYLHLFDLFHLFHFSPPEHPPKLTSPATGPISLQIGLTLYLLLRLRWTFCLFCLEHFLKTSPLLIPGLALNLPWHFIYIYPNIQHVLFICHVYILSPCYNFLEERDFPFLLYCCTHSV
jgi:hypothetical protein